MVIMLLWLSCSTPLVLIGAFFGVKKKAIKNPCKVNNLPQQIPPKAWYLKTGNIMFFAGIFPFL
jgi:transmembrane 9 superfamily protein 2/4